MLEIGKNVVEPSYYDKNYLEIEEGDLLKVYHFKAPNRLYFMYQIAVLDNKGYWKGKSYHVEDNEVHYRLLSLANKETRVMPSVEIVCKENYWENEDKLRREARKRKKELTKKN